MTLRELKDWVNNLPEDNLDKPLTYNSEYYCISGFIEKVEIAPEDLYWLGDDDPSDLYSLSELFEMYDYTEEEIYQFEIAIHKGDPIIFI